MKLNIKQIEVFSAVMEHGSTTAASTHLRISQPSISKHLKLLETSSGVNLFVRNTNRLIPTPEAKALYEEIKRTYVGVSHLEKFVRNLSGNVKYEIGIGSISMLSSKWLPKVVSNFLNDYDHFSISIPTGTHHSIGTWVASGRVDIGICMQVSADIDVNQELLIRLPHVCVMSDKHEKADRSLISSSDLDGETLITLLPLDEGNSSREEWRLAVQDQLEEAKVKPRNLVSVSTSHHACELVSTGLGVALVDTLTAMDYEGQNTTWVPTDFDFTFDIYLITPKAEMSTGLVEDFLRQLKSEAAILQAEINSRHR